MSAEIMPASTKIMISTKKWPKFIIHIFTLHLTRSLDINTAEAGLCVFLGFGFWVLGFGFWVLGFGLFEVVVL